MALHGETAINPTPPPPPPPPGAPPLEADPYRSTTLKRQRDDGYDAEGTFGDAPAPKRRMKVELDVVYRIVVPSRQIGKVIGKVGSRIQKIREDTKATVKIADAISRHEERVIIISSKDSDNIFCDAENALHHIATLILKEDDVNAEALKVGAGHVAANSIRLLIAGSQAGGLIGVSGQNIEKLRNSSGATITVLAPNQLPLCASAHESDRVVQISGDVPAVLRALVEMGCQLRDNPPKQVISISPTFNFGFNRPPQQNVDPTSAEYVNMAIMVPESLVGGLIGRCGSNISRIRSESGATIKVYGGKGEQTHRQIHLGGSSQQVAIAKQRVDEYVYSQLIQAGGQQSVSHEAENMTTIPPVYTSTAALPPTYASTAALPPAYAPTAALPPAYAPTATLPPMYAPTATNQAAYYGPSFHAPL